MKSFNLDLIFQSVRLEPATFLDRYNMRPALVLFALVLFQAALSFQIQPLFKQFQEYLREYQKDYSQTVQLYRFQVYLSNLKLIQQLNDNPQDPAIYGETRFTDLTPQEAKAHMGLLLPEQPNIHYVKNFTNDPEYRPRTDVPDTWNWTSQGVVGPIRDQGSCGSCWTFSTAGNIESLNFMRNRSGELTPMSQQQLIDCDKTNFGCSGGWPYRAIQWLADNGGLMAYADYPLRSNYSGPCEFAETKASVKVEGYMNVTHEQGIIRDALYETGPLSILLDFTGLMHYKSGVANPLLCSTWPDHALVLVGYGSKDHDYWLIKNSWGPKWGQNGYLMLKRGANKCGINLWATTAVLK